MGVEFVAIGTKVWRCTDDGDNVCVAECATEDAAREVAIEMAIREWQTGPN